MKVQTIEIVIVDHEPKSRTLLKNSLLEGVERRVTFKDITNAAEGLALCEQLGQLAAVEEVMPLVIINLDMPGLDVARIFGSLHGEGEVVVVPAIAVATDTPAARVETALEHGAQAYLNFTTATPHLIRHTVFSVVERLELVRSLRESEKRFRMVSELTSDYAYMMQVTAENHFVNEWITGAFEEITGYTFEEVDRNVGWSKLVHKGDLPQLRRRRKLLLVGEPTRNEFRIVRKDGAVRWLHEYTQPVLGADGRVQKIYGAARDITSRKEAEESLKAWELMFNKAGWSRATISSGQRPSVEAAVDTSAHDVGPEALDDEARLAVLRRTKLLDSPPEHAFDRLTEMACRLLNVPVSLVSLVDKDRQFFKSQRGLVGKVVQERQTPLSHSFCQHVVTTHAPLIVTDAREDARVARNLAIEELGVISYLGIPLLSPDGHALGSLCAIDNEPREWTAEDVELLSNLAQSVMTEIALRLQFEELKLTEEALRHSEERFRLVLKNSPVLVGTCDLERRFTWLYNTNMGFDIAKALGKRVEELLPRVDTAEIVALQEAVLTNGVGERREVAFRLGDGVHYFDITAEPLRDNNHTVVGLTMAGLEITERKRYAAELEAINHTLEERVLARTSELERSNRELDQFAYVASHDLKAPLRAIRLLANWLAEDNISLLNEGSRSHLEKMQTRIGRMEKLLDDLLIYSRAGRRRGRPEEVNLADLLADIVYFLAIPAGFSISVPHDLPILTTYRVPLETVFRNLLSNAIKHHGREQGSIQITWQDLGDWLEFRINDDGQGIDPAFHERIFGVFQTLKPRDLVEGSGIGLSIVRKTVESVGGAVTLDSAEGEGTTFTFTWPKEIMPSDRMGAV